MFKSLKKYISDKVSNTHCVICQNKHLPGKFGSGTLSPSRGPLGGVWVRASRGCRFLSCSLTVRTRFSRLGSLLRWFLLQNFWPGITLVLEDFGEGDLLLGWSACILSCSLCFLMSLWANFMAISILSLDKELELTSTIIFQNV